MREHLPKIVIVGLLVLIVGVPFLLRPRAEATLAVEEAARLIAFTPHNEQIRFELARAFNDHRRSQGKPDVAFDWRASGGTSDLRKTVLAQFKSLADRGAEDAGIGVDLFFGGGDFEHNQLARGVAVTRDGQEMRIPATVPIDIPEDVLKSAFPEPTIGGEPLYHKDRFWVGVVLSSFGIVYNRDLLEMLNAPEPSGWQTLAAPQLKGFVALADPAHSGSIAQTFNVIVRRRGWHEGWWLLRRTFANARYFTSSASKVPVDVSAGETAAGMCIDFYGRFQAGAVESADGSSRVGYVDPPYTTATTADPISILRGAPHPELAREFVLWLLTPEAQRLWQYRIGAPGGPTRFELRRQPVRRDLYTDAERTHWTDPKMDPWGTSKPLPKPIPNYYAMVAPLSHAMAIDVHDDLVAAWEAILGTSPEHENLPEMLRLFDAMPPELILDWNGDDELRANWQTIVENPNHPRHAEAAAALKAFSDSLAKLTGDADELLRKRLEWTLFFRANYQRMVELAGE